MKLQLLFFGLNIQKKIVHLKEFIFLPGNSP